MNKILSALLAGAAAAGFASCNDFLDKEPISSLIPENYFGTEADLAAYSINLYGMLPTHSNYNWEMGTFSIDNGTDNQASYSANVRFIPGEWKVSASGGWSFTNLRNCNYFLDYVLPKYQAGQIKGGQAAIKHHIGEVYFFRAYSFWQQYEAYGDLPIVLNALTDEKDVLMEATVRQPRNKVARQILSDLDKAIELMSETSPAGKQRLNKACAQLFKSRVALFEATWLKYHKGTALVPGGAGWPGDPSMISGFNIDDEISFFLSEAKSAAQPVADAIVGNLAANTGSDDGMNSSYGSLNPYYTMFCEADLNPYAEVLAYRQYSSSLSIYNNIQEQLIRNGCGSGWTRGMVNSHVMANGLPIYASGSGYDPEWENQGITATLQGRDSRIRVFTKLDNCITSYSASGEPGYNAFAYFLTGSDKTKFTTGYGCKKGMNYRYQYSIDRYGETASILFLGTEALLNYIEASYELNGQIDGNAQRYWTALRSRALVDTDFRKTIAATDMTEETKWDWGAYSSGKVIDPTLYNIRRERRCELSAMGLRMMDLRRWSAMDQLAANPYQLEGMKFWGTVYDASAGENPLNIRNTDGDLIPVVADPSNPKSNISAQSLSDYVRVYQRTNVNNLAWNGLSFTLAHYLSPLSVQNFVNTSPDGNVDNSVVYQNPGWGKVASQGASPIQ